MTVSKSSTWKPKGGYKGCFVDKSSSRVLQQEKMTSSAMTIKVHRIFPQGVLGGGGGSSSEALGQQAKEEGDYHIRSRALV